MNSLLSKSELTSVIKNSPLIAIDLIITNDNGDYLLGVRTNKPAQNYWFVPGGRIRKGEHFEEAFRRISKDELGMEFSMADAKFLGVFEHHYKDNVFDEPGFGTHYIVLGYAIEVKHLSNLPQKQHSQYRWFSKLELLQEPQVHQNTKNYFS